MRPVLLLLPFLLAACDPAAMTELNQALGIEPETPPGPPPLPPTVAAVLPPGANPALVFQDNAGCYLFSVEVTDPPSGFPLFDAAGNPICEGQAATIAVPVGPAT